MPGAGYGGLSFPEAIEYFRRKGYAVSARSWRDVWQEMHARAFTVARVTAMEVLEDIRRELDLALSEGRSLAEFRKTLALRLERKGWMAPRGERAEVELPDGTRRKRLTGWRIENIFRTNVQTAYSVGRWRQMQEVKNRRPFWQYKAVLDSSTRPAHAAMDGKVFHADHPVWNQWYPPNGFGCRCYVRSLSARQMQERGLREQRRGVSEKPDEGWRYNPGAAGLDAWKPDMKGFSPEARVLLRAALKKVLFHKAETDAGVRDFIRNRDRLPKHLKAFVTPHSAKDYRRLGAEVYMTRDGLAGYAITRDRDLISVFSLPGARRGAEVVADAIERGARSLDCIDGKLPEFYNRFGFKEYDRIAWDDKYAPKDWDYDRFGRPDIVYMRLKPKSKRGV